MLEDLQLSAADLPQVIFTGRVSGPELEAIADKSDAGLLPYPSGLDFRRSIPNKAIEYMAYGLPIITSLSGPVSELINHDRCGFLYRETDPQDLALLIAKLVENPSLLKACSIQVKRVFRERFRASSVYGRMVHELMTIANHPSAKGLG
jgi:glycosyltransferase involved in cell wall biosynthesis